MEREIVIIPDADSELSLKVIRCLGKSRMYDTLLVSKTSDNPALKSKYCKRAVIFSGNQDSELMNLLFKLGDEIPEGIIMPVSTDGFRFVSRNREALARHFRIVLLPSVEHIDIASDKWCLFELAKHHGMPVLPSYSLSQEIIIAIIRGQSDIVLPVLVKSRNRGGGFGFQKFITAKELEQFGASLSPNIQDEYIIQPFIDGADYSLSVYCEQGQIKAYTLWRALAYGGRQYSIPRILQFVEHDGILSTGKQLMSVLNWQGVCDIDFFVDKRSGNFWLLEINARFWQTVVAALVAGVNFPLLLCEQAKGLNHVDWPSQRVGLNYSRPSGLLSLFGLLGIISGSLSLLRGDTGLGEILRDPKPEVSQKLKKLKNHFVYRKLIKWLDFFAKQFTKNK